MSSRPRGRPLGGDPTVATDQLLDRALEMFAERGYEAMSVRELARELGVSHNLIPQRIGSKERLWFQAVDRGFGNLAVALAETIRDLADEADDVVRLRAMVVRFIEANAQRPALLQIINQEENSAGSPLRPDIVRAVSRVTDTMWPGVIVLPVMSTGATDGRMLRAAGIPTYGVTGFFGERDDNRAHGRDERMMVRSFYEGQRFLYELVKTLATAQ